MAFWRLLIYNVLRTLNTGKGFLSPLRSQELIFAVAAADWVQHRKRTIVKLHFHEEWIILHSQPQACFFSCINNWGPYFSLSIVKKWCLCKHFGVFSQEFCHSREDVRASQNTWMFSDSAGILIGCHSFLCKVLMTPVIQKVLGKGKVLYEFNKGMWCHRPWGSC